MKESLKLVWSRIPKKRLFSIITFLLGYLGKLGLDHFVRNEPFSIPEQAPQTFVGSLLLVGVYFLGSFLFFGLKVIKELREQKVSIPVEVHRSTPVKKKKELPNRFEIEVLNFKRFEYTVFVKRWWFPNTKPPSVEDFLRAVEFSEVRCGECHSDFYISYSGGSFKHYKCTNPDCKNNETYYTNLIYTLGEQVRAKYFGDIRKDYKKYWETYRKTYLEYTSNKPEEYADP